MTHQDKNKMIPEKTERIPERQDQKEDRKGRFLPIFFWSD
jgi:hypothetical protein